MTRVKPGNPGQEALFAAAPVTTEMHMHDFATDAPLVSLAEHRLQQLNVLNIFSTIHEKEWMLKNPEAIARQYPKNHAKVLEATAEQRKNLEIEAKAEFFRSLGYYAVQDSGRAGDMTPYVKDAERRWTIFQAKFRSVRKAPARYAEIDRLLVELKGFNDDRTSYNREHGLRPHAPNKARVRRSTEDKKPALRNLTSRERLVAVQEDPRAGFLPANNDEKNKVLMYLDYLDNPLYPLGINNQFFEVFTHQQHLKNKPNGLELAQQAMVSIPYELGDHLINSTESLAHLRQLDEEVSDCPNPNISLLEVEGISPDHPGLGALIRYRDLRELRDKQKLPVGIKDPLRVKEDRRPHDEPGKNKTLEDLYTRKELTEEMKAYIIGQAGNYAVGQVRKLVKAAIEDQEMRQAFLAARLRDFRFAPDSRFLPMWAIAEKLLDGLGLPTAVA